METYTPENLSRWTPEDPAFGGSDNYVGADLTEFYVAPIGTNRDNQNSVSLSNWRTLGPEIAKLCNHEESGVHCFNHWGCGWYELWLIHESDTEALKFADNAAEALADYPLWNEEDHSEIELEKETEAWDSWGRTEFISELESVLKEYAPEDGDCYWAGEVLEGISEEKIDNFWNVYSRQLGWSCEHLNDGPRFNFSGIKQEITCEMLAELTGLPLLPQSQVWRREPYPWPDGSQDPLAPPLPAFLEN